MRNIPDKLLSISTLVSLGSSSGSGFIYASDKFLYFVTGNSAESEPPIPQ